jgi:hypothetical protein
VPTPVLPPSLTHPCRQPASAAGQCRDQHCEAPVAWHTDCRKRPGAPQLTLLARGTHAGASACARGPGAAAGRARLTRAGMCPLTCSHELPNRGFLPYLRTQAQNRGKRANFWVQVPPRTHIHAPDLRLFVWLHVNVDKTAAHRHKCSSPSRTHAYVHERRAASLIPAYPGHEAPADGAVSVPWPTRLRHSGDSPVS